MKKGLGWILVCAASLLWIACIIIPFLSFTVGVKTAIIATLIVAAEILFWLGALLIGKNIWQYLKERKRNKD
ncbi:MAG: transporter suffix domain-containing protein [Lysinibacillus sp.]